MRTRSIPATNTVQRPQAPTHFRVLPLERAAAARCDGPGWTAEIAHGATTSRASRSIRPRICSMATARGRRIRPTIGSVGPAAIRLRPGVPGDQTLDAADIHRSCWSGPVRSTHAFDMEQRFVRAVVYTSRSGVADCHGAAERQHRPARLLHAVHPELRRRAVGANFVQLSPSDESAADGDDRQPGAATSRSIPATRCVFRVRQRPRWHDRRLLMDVPRRQSGIQLLRRGRQRRLRDARELRGVAHRDRQRGESEHAGDAHRDGGGFCVVRDSHVAVDHAGRLRQLHGDGRWRAPALPEPSNFAITGLPAGCHRVVRSTGGHRLRVDDAERVDERRHARRQLSADDHGNEWNADADVHVTLVVNATASFTLSATPASRTIAQGRQTRAIR